jgi:hypothetical protein
MGGPANANAGRGGWFRTTMRSPAAITGLVLGMSAALLLGAHFGGPAGALAAPLAVAVAVAGFAWWLADRRAEMVFWKHVADSLGYQPFWDATAVETTTPLLHAGDRRFWKHQLMGPLGDSGLTARLAQYRFDVRHENSKGEDTWDSYRWTICLVEIEAGMALFPGVYLRERRGLLARLGHHDWLRGGLREVELESTEFNDAYELRAVRNQDEGQLRELFDPKTIVWLAEHPLRPHLEFRAGFLVVYVPGYLEDLGRVVWLLEAAERLAERVQAEVGESHAAVTGEPAAG